MASKAVGSRFLPWKQENQENRKPSARNRRRVVTPPIEFVKEQQALFAAVDNFELESEEESPVSKPYIRGMLDRSRESEPIIPRKVALEIVPEDEFEEVTDALSAALLTPRPISIRYQRQEPSAGDTQNSVIHNAPLEFEDCISRRSLSICHELASNHDSESEIFSDHYDWEVEEEEEVASCCSSLGGGHERLSLDCDLLASGLRSLSIEAYELLTGHTSVEKEKSCSVNNENNRTEDTYLVQLSDEILLETPARSVLPSYQALLQECHQIRPFSLGEAISGFCDMSEVVKLGEGTFGEVFKGGGCVFKIVPMEGDLLVNGEVQKTCTEIYSEVLLTNTLNRLRCMDSQDPTKLVNLCSNFIETKAIRICQGRYGVELCSAWEEWNTTCGSDNEHPLQFHESQSNCGNAPLTKFSCGQLVLGVQGADLYVVFVLADGGKDLETFSLSNFNEAQTILLQVALALAVAEVDCGFEHRDLHWGNVVLTKDPQQKCGHYRLLGKDLTVKTFGLSVSIIDFTLSRIDTGKHVLFCNLSADEALFEGPSGDIQSDTYKRMLNLTKGNWDGRFPRTNAFWIHYLTDILLHRKSYCYSSSEKRALRAFCKRVLLCKSAQEAVSDDFFKNLWI